MTDHQPPQTFFDKLQQATKMRPKWWFMVEHGLIGLAIVLVALGLVFFGSLVGYFWRSAHFSDLPVFGGPGYGLIVRTFPWWEVIVTLLGAVALVYLIRRHTKLYRWPLAATLGVFVVAFAGASWIAIASPLHDDLSNRAIRGRLPIVGPWYRSGQPLVRGLITPGTIASLSPNRWMITTPTGETVNLDLSSSTDQEPNWTPTVGDRIVVIGRRTDHTIQAEDIRRAAALPHRRPFFLDRELNETNPEPPAY